jgi:hypothetical protein
LGAETNPPSAAVTALQQELAQREAAIRKLTEELAIARTDSELFQKKWAEAQLRAQTLGVKFGDSDDSVLPRELIESVRALHLAELERQRLVDQLKRLLAGLEGSADVTAEVARTKSVLAASRPAVGGVTTNANVMGPEPTLESAQVLEVNPNLQMVVLNVGFLHGARVGMPFVVLRGDRVVAELKVVEVRRRICGALIKKVDEDVTLAAGDAARVTKS